MTDEIITSQLANEIPVVENRNGAGAIEWLSSRRNEVEAILNRHGIVLLRGFAAKAADTVENALAVFSNELLDDAYWSTPRSGVANKTFTATEYPREKTIALHSEMAYMSVWPRFVGFHSLTVAEVGGETSVGNIDRISGGIADLMPEFNERGVMYRRTYHPGIDIPWQKAFQTDDPLAVKAIADKIGMQTSWLSDDVLQTVHCAQGCVTSETAELLWFNQAHIFHASNLPSETLLALVELFGEDQLPRSSFYGDGSPIPDAVMKRIIEAFEHNIIKVPWQEGDVLIVDNMRYAHGRLPFKGTRKLHVAMAEAYDAKERLPLFS